MPPLTLMFKTVSSDCNLDCRYCYYRQSLEGERACRRIETEMLERLIPQYMAYIADAHQANISWQGGEPTLAGLDFFRNVVALEAKSARPPTVISNVIQTNAVLLNDEWADFFAAYQFLVGVSLDGPEAIHNAERKDRGGHGSFLRVMAGIEALRRHKVDFNILCVVGVHNVNRVGELMSFFRREGLHYLQFIPAMAFQSTEPLRPASYLIAPQEYGTFLTNIFDEWYTGGVPILSIRTFDNFLQSYLGVANDLCIHSSTCDAGVVVEYNGDIYPCDFYIHPQWRLGNISEKSLQEMVANPAFRRFTCQKSPLPVACQPCRWQKFCKSECFRNRQAATGVSYFCPAYREFFEYAHERLATLGERLASYRRYLQWLNTSPGRKAHRNDACPCGSGRKFKNCCGDPALAGSYLFQPDCGRVP